jgi:hypothetical protein
VDAGADEYPIVANVTGREHTGGPATSSGYHSPAAVRRLDATMFGPLNGVRTALVVAAAIAALLAGVLGQWMVAVVLMLAVAVHGLGWLYLYRHRPDGEA